MGKRKSFLTMADDEKRVEAKRGINFFMQFFRAIPPETYEQMSADDLLTLLDFLSEHKDKVSTELHSREI